jgi:hypothetical protein
MKASDVSGFQEHLRLIRKRLTINVFWIRFRCVNSAKLREGGENEPKDVEEKFAAMRANPARQKCTFRLLLPNTQH